MNEESLAIIIKKHFEAADRRFDKLEGRFDEMNERFDALLIEVRAIKSDLARLQERVDDMSGFAKEIDDLSERVSEIEGHLGIARKIAA